MGLNLEISLDKDIRELDQFMTDLKFKVVVKSARQALNRTATQVKSNAIKEIRKRRKMKLKDLKGTKKSGGFVRSFPAKGSNLFDLQSKVLFSGLPLPMILFIVGQASPMRSFAPNHRRKSRRFEIKQGQKTAKKGLFVQKAKRGTRAYQVFRRADKNDRSKGYKLQSAPSIAQYLRGKQNIMRKIENHAIASLQKNYSRVLEHNLKSLKL